MGARSPEAPSWVFSHLACGVARSHLCHRSRAWCVSACLDLFLMPSAAAGISLQKQWTEGRTKEAGEIGSQTGHLVGIRQRKEMNELAKCQGAIGGGGE